jgi:hypothetical protein
MNGEKVSLLLYFDCYTFRYPKVIQPWTLSVIPLRNEESSSQVRKRAILLQVIVPHRQAPKLLRQSNVGNRYHASRGESSLFERSRPLNWITISLICRLAMTAFRAKIDLEKRSQKSAVLSITNSPWRFLSLILGQNIAENPPGGALFTPWKAVLSEKSRFQIS